jgi:hypothetical protein
MEKKFCCLNCNTSFRRKEHLSQHMNRINPCVKKDTLIAPQLLSVSYQNLCEKGTNSIYKKDEQMNDDYICKYCKKFFSKKYNLDRHIKNVCGKINENNKEENNSVIKEQNEIQIKKELDILKNENEKLKTHIIDLISKNKEITKIHESIKKLETTIPANTNLTISNQYLEKIIQKEKEIEEIINQKDKGTIYYC